MRGGGGWGAEFLAASGDIQLGDLATWTGAIITAGALVLALLQVFRERSERLRREADDRSKADQDRVDRHLAHARLLSAWTGAPEERSHHSDISPELPRRERARLERSRARLARELPQVVGDLNWRTPIYMHNGSSEPVYNVVAGLVFVQGAAPHNLEGILEVQRRLIDESKSEPQENRPPGPVPVDFQPVTTLSILPPGTWRSLIRGGSWSGIMGGRLGVDLAFTDRAGAHWVRRAMGHLEQLDKEPFEHFQEHGLYGPLNLVHPEPIQEPPR